MCRPQHNSRIFACIYFHLYLFESTLLMYMHEQHPISIIFNILVFLSNHCFCFQVWSPTSTSPWSGRRASRRLHRQTILLTVKACILTGLCSETLVFRLTWLTRTSHWYFIINIIANDEWLRFFIIVIFPITRNSKTNTFVLGLGDYGLKIRSFFSSNLWVVPKCNDSLIRGLWNYT